MVAIGGSGRSGGDVVSVFWVGSVESESSGVNSGCSARCGFKYKGVAQAKVEKGGIKHRTMVWVFSMGTEPRGTGGLISRHGCQTERANSDRPGKSSCCFAWGTREVILLVFM